MTTSGVYEYNGITRVTVVSGATSVGLYASDGSINIVLDDSSTSGVYHKSGAYRVNSANSPTNQVYDSTGAYYASFLLQGAPPTISPVSPNTVWITDSDGVYLIDDFGAYYVEA